MEQTSDIIKIFYDDPTGVCSINEISRLIGSPYGTTYNYVQTLIKEKVLKSCVKGRSNLCSLNFESQKAIELLSIISVSKKDTFSKKEAIISEALDKLANRVREKSDHNIFSIVLFGSIVKGSATKKSDIDLFFICTSKDKYDEIIEDECNVLRMSYGMDISSIIAEPIMYINMLREKGENVGKQILKNKIIFYGANKYWELTLEGLGEKG